MEGVHSEARSEAITQKLCAFPFIHLQLCNHQVNKPQLACWRMTSQVEQNMGDMFPRWGPKNMREPIKTRHLNKPTAVLDDSESYQAWRGLE
jgi:hypothetical protein